MFFIVALVLGSITLPVSIWMYQGRSDRARFWYGQEGFIDIRTVTLFFPALTMFLLGMGLSQVWSFILPKDSVTLLVLTALTLTIAAVGLVGSLWGMLPIPYPQKWQPRWYRQLEAATAKRSSKKRKGKRR